MTLQLQGLVPEDDQTTPAATPPYEPPQKASPNDISGLVKESADSDPSFLARAWKFIRSDLPEAVARDLTPTINIPGSAPASPAPGLSSSPDVPPQIISNPNAYIARGARDVGDKLSEYPNPEYGYTPTQADVDQIRAQNAKERAEFNQRYGYDPAMPWFRGVGQAGATAPVLGPILGMAGGVAETVAPGVGEAIAGLEGLPGFAARTAVRAGEGGVGGAGVGALTADPSQPVGPQIGQGALWGLGTGAALSPILEGLPRLATETPPGGLPPVTQSGTAKGIANVAFDKARAAGAGLTADAVNGGLDAAGKVTIVPEDARSAVDPNAATSVAAQLDTLRGKPLSLDGIKAVVENIDTKIDGETKLDGSLTTVGRKLLQQKNALLDMVENAKPGDVTGDASGFDAWNDGKDAWKYQLQMRQLEALRQKAAGTPDPAATIKTGVNAMAYDDGRMKGWSPEARDALQQVGKTGFLSEAGDTLADKYIGSMMMAGLGGGIGTLLSPVLPGLGTGLGIAGGVASRVALARGIRALQQASAQRQLQGVITGLGEHIRGQQLPENVWPQPTGGLLGTSTP